jgi:hypothetical protein
MVDDQSIPRRSLPAPGAHSCRFSMNPLCVPPTRSEIVSTSVHRHSDDCGTAFTARQRSDGKGQSDLRRQVTLAIRIASCHISLFLEQNGLSERNWSATADERGSLMNRKKPFSPKTRKVSPGSMCAIIVVVFIRSPFRRETSPQVKRS